MGENNKSSAQLPLHAIPKIFNAAMRTAFEIAAAFWRPWFRQREKQEVPAPSEEAPQSTKRAQRPNPLRQKPAAQKKPRLARPTKRSLKEEQGPGARRANPEDGTLA